MTLTLNTESESPERTTVHVHGRLDAQTFGDFDLAMLDLLPRVADGGTMVLDLAALEYISSAGLRSILAATKKLKAQNGSLALCALSGLVEEVVTVSGFDNILQVFPDLDQAMKEE